MQYKNKDGKRTDVYLYLKDHRDQIELPLNKYFWKVVHDAEKNEAVVFVGINDPHWEITQKGDQDPLFKNVKNVCPKKAERKYSCLYKEQVKYCRAQATFCPVRVNFVIHNL